MTRHDSALADAFIAAALGIVAGIVLSIIVVAATAATPRSAAVIPSGFLGFAETDRPQIGAPLKAVGSQSGAFVTADGRSAFMADGAQSPSHAAVPPVASGPTTPAHRDSGGTPRPARVVPSGVVGPSIHGDASWVRASLGSHYLAARMPRGTVLRICGPLACIVRTVNDYGPSAKAFPERIVDLSAKDYQRVCGPLSSGICPVSVAVR